MGNRIGNKIMAIYEYVCFYWISSIGFYFRMLYILKEVFITGLISTGNEGRFYFPLFYAARPQE
jgi:hypothetical protein